MLLSLVVPLGLPLLAAPPEVAGEMQRVAISVRETAGLRRFGFPLTAAVPFAAGAFRDERQARLVNGQGKEVPAQVTVTERWPRDGSIRWLEIDFAASPGPHAVEEFFLERGPAVARTRPTRGVMLSEADDHFQAGPYRVPKGGQPLLSSVRYGDLEYLRPEGAAFALTGGDGAARPVRTGSVRTRALKTEPILVMLEQRGEYASPSGAPLPFRTTMEFPSTKSWVRLVHEIEGPRREARSVTLRLPFALETAPRLFDFGVGSWLYGVLRPEQAATLTQRVAAPGADGPTNWEVRLGGADAAPYAAGAPPSGPARAEGWAHLMDGKKVIALGVAGFAAASGETTIRLEHDGDCELRWRPEAGGGDGPLRVEAYFHFIPVPAQLTAATSPPAMLAPLVARCSADTYRAAGVPEPR